MFYVPCIISKIQESTEVYFRIKNLNELFKKEFVFDMGKKYKILHRGIPQSLIDIYSNTRFDIKILN